MPRGSLCVHRTPHDVYFPFGGFTEVLHRLNRSVTREIPDFDKLPQVDQRLEIQAVKRENQAWQARRNLLG